MHQSTRLALHTVIILTLGFTGASQAQDYPPKEVIGPTLADDATDVHAADLDGDSDVDVISASSGDDKIAWYENKSGSSSFSEQRIITTNAASAEDVHAADLDGDGDMDVISASSGDNNIAWYENTTASFSDQNIISDNAVDVRLLQSADLDNDGDQDIISASDDSGEIFWYENNGGSFSNRKIITTGVNFVESVYPADMSKNGRTDILTSLENKIVYYENEGEEVSFSEPDTIASDIISPSSAIASDLNNDDNLDVVAGVSDKLVWYEHKENKFESGKVIFNRDNEILQSVASDDLDGDGDKDVISASGNRVHIHDNQINDSGGFGSALLVSAATIDVQSVHVSEVDGDSFPDILSASLTFDETVYFHPNRLDEEGEFADAVPLVPTQLVENVSSIDINDINNDNHKDIVLSTDDKISWYENDGESFLNQITIVTGRSNLQSVRSADLNLDGYADIISSSFNSGEIFWIENNGESFSEEHLITSNADGVHSAIPADVNGDDIIDIIATVKDRVVWFENDGSNFSQEQIISDDLSAATTVTAVDVNSDGSKDIVAGSHTSGDDNKIVWFENNSGSFSDANVIATNLEGSSDLTTADLDNDGDLDLIASSDGDSQGFDDIIAWFENVDVGFSERNNLEGGFAEPTSISAADLNGDSRSDIIAAGADQPAWFKHEGFSFGSISFSDEKEMDPVENVRGGVVEVADLDGNGSQDVVVGLRVTSNDRLVWYENSEGTLPVELASFNGTTTTKNVRLTWKTATETNNSGFDVQRREGGPSQAEASSWTTVGFVEGAGTTSEPQSYRFTDEDLPYDAARLTYRLRQVDTDGTTTLSDPVVVERSVNKLELLGTFPNPASQQATVRYALPTPQDVDIHLYDALGRQVRTVVDAQKEGRHEERVDLSGLSSGTYFLRLEAGSATKSQQVTVVR